MKSTSFIILLIGLIAVTSAQSNYELLLSRPDIDGLSSDDDDGTDLDDVPTTGLAVGTMIAVYDGSETRIYRLTAGTDAESSPQIIRPDDFADPANAKVWITRLSSDPSETGHSEVINNTVIYSGDTLIDMADKEIFAFPAPLSSIILTLPAASASSVGKYFIIHNVSSSGGIVNIDANGTDNLNGISGGSISIGQFQTIRVIGYTSNHWIVSN